MSEVFRVWVLFYVYAFKQSKVYESHTLPFSETSNTTWQNACIDIHSYSSDAHVVFEGTRGTSFYGDIAIDDVTLENGNCSNLQSKGKT